MYCINKKLNANQQINKQNEANHGSGANQTRSSNTCWSTLVLFNFGSAQLILCLFNLTKFDRQTGCRRKLCISEDIVFALFRRFVRISTGFAWIFATFVSRHASNHLCTVFMQIIANICINFQEICFNIRLFENISFAFSLSLSFFFCSFCCAIIDNKRFIIWRSLCLDSIALVFCLPLTFWLFFLFFFCFCFFVILSWSCSVFGRWTRNHRSITRTYHHFSLHRLPRPYAFRPIFCDRIDLPRSICSTRVHFGPKSFILFLLLLLLLFPPSSSS